MKTNIPALVVSVLLVSSVQAAAAPLGSVRAATGGASVATVERGEVGWTNPASMAHARGYNFSSGYTSGISEFTSQTGRLTGFRLGLSENLKQTTIPASFDYAQSDYDTKDVAFETGSRTILEQRRFRLSFGNFYSPNLAGGFNVNHAEDRLLGQVQRQTNLGFGALWTPNPTYGFGLVVDDVLAPSAALDPRLHPERRIELGYSYNYRRFLRLRADVASGVNQNFSTPLLRGGFEYYLNQWMLARVGTSWDSAKVNTYNSGGFGLVLPRFSLNYAFENRDRHLIDLMIPVW